MTQRRTWVPIILFFPTLYLFGWLSVQPLRLIPFVNSDDLDLFVTLFSFFYFLICLPSWVKLRWREAQPWAALGLSGLLAGNSIKEVIKGLLFSIGLIGVLLITLFIGSWGVWSGDLSFGSLVNAIFLGLGVGLAEELIFRGWLWGELNFLLGPRLGIFSQAAIFSIVHIHLGIGSFNLLAHLFGLFLLGLVLALRRSLDKGSLSGCIGLHGGLVGIWFCISSGLINIEPNTPWWVLGPGGITSNPLGGLIAIFSLGLILWSQRTAFAIAGRPSTGACKASSRGAIP